MQRLIPWLAALLTMALFVRLGFWQLDREQEKRALFDGFSTALTQPPRLLDPYTPQPRFSRVELEGQFTGIQFLLDNQVFEGSPGVHVYAPFNLTSVKQTVLVNRGWLPMERTRRTLPDLPTLPFGNTRVQGHLSSYPQPGIKVGQPDYETPQPWLLIYMEPDTLAEALGLPLAPQVMLETSPEPTSFTQQWAPKVMAPEKHRGYAVQWFSLAVAVLIVTLILALKKDPKTSTP
ncbi:MAG: SURF1 family protein [Lysobacterales bacterium]